MELANSWSQWLEVLTANGFAVRASIRPPATPAALAALERAVGAALPAGAHELYALADGEETAPGAAAIFGFYRFLSTEAAAREHALWQGVARDLGPEQSASFAENVTSDPPGVVRAEYWHPSWIPFARDGGGNALAFDLAPGPEGTAGQIIIFGPDEDRRRAIAPGVASLFERLLEAARSHELTFGGDGAQRWYEAPSIFS